LRLSVNSNTDPFNPDDPGDPIVFVDVQLSIETPAQISNPLNDPNEPTSSPTATLNGEPVDLTFDGTNWIGAGTAQLNENVSTGTTIFILNDDFELGFDNDSDGLTNVDEFNGGSNPEDANSPSVDPCEISQFNQGCDIDTDEDGV